VTDHGVGKHGRDEASIKKKTPGEYPEVVCATLHFGFFEEATGAPNWGFRWIAGAIHPPAVRDYSMIFDTTPAPTVRPPSRIAKRRPCSIAIGAISSTVNATLSPGITISVPSFRFTVPVTSVVRK
jgi:hypothetical protein